MFFFLCSACYFMMLYICEKLHQNIWNNFQLTVWSQAQGRNVPCSKGNNSKSRQTRVMVHVFCRFTSQCFTCVRSFVKISWTVFNLQNRHKYIVEMISVQRATTPKVEKPELEFVCCAHRFIMLYIRVKFGENILDSFRVMERIWMMEVVTDGQTY